MGKARTFKPSDGFTRRRRRLSALGALAPRFSLALDWGNWGASDLYLTLPFRRHRVAILIGFVFFAAFSVPLITVGGNLLGSYDGELFSLVSILFSLFWLLGWSVGVVVLGAVFFVLSCGRETLRVRDNTLILRVGVPGLGFGAIYQGDAIRNFRRREPDEASGNDWRGDHLAFDYGGDQIGFGSNIDEEQARRLLTELKTRFPQQGSAAVQIAPVSEEPVQHPPPLAGVVQAGEPEAVSFTSLSSLALIAANLVPLAGVLLYGWDIGQVMLLFWAESAVIGFYTLLKMAKIGGWLILLYGPFFVGHFGAFMVVHLLFIYGLFVSNLNDTQDVPLSDVAADFTAMAPALLAFLISHGVSYVTNFRAKKKFGQSAIGEEMTQPYRRIGLMHVTIIFGGFLVLATGTALAGLLLFILLKLIADLRAHVAQHSQN